MITGHHKAKRGEPVDTSALIKTGDTGWKTVRRVRQVETEYQGISYALRKRIELSYGDEDDHNIKLDWARSGVALPPRNIPHAVVKFLMREVDRG
jgi:hypothetical protein